MPIIAIQLLLILQ